MQPTARLVRLAARAVVDRQIGSVYAITRALDTDLGTATALMGELETAGIVGPEKKPAGRMRDVLLTPDQLTQARLAALTVTAVDA